MSRLDRDGDPKNGFSYTFDMGVDGRFKVDVFRAHEPVLNRWHEEVLIDLEGLRTSDEKVDSVTIALAVADARVLMGVIRQAVEFIENERKNRDTKHKENQ